MIASVCINLGLLGFFKYAGFLTNTLNYLPFLNIPTLKIPLPIGISFYTFQTMSYSIDVYRGDAPVQKNIITFGTYVSLFPQLIAGPIVRYKDVAYQLDHRRETLDQFTKGVCLFCVGLGKKVLIANQMGALWDNMRETGEMGWLGSWVGIIAYTFQIYFDWATCSALSSSRTSTIPISVRVSPSSGADGISRWAHGSENTCISHWAATAWACRDRSLTC